MASLNAGFFCKRGSCGLMVNELQRVSCVIVALSATLRFLCLCSFICSRFSLRFRGDEIGLIKGRIHEMHL